MLDDLAIALVVAATLVLLARPIAVATALLPWRTPGRQIAVISWAGLRGAVPVVLATIPFTAGYPDGALIFDVAFVVVVVSVALQAPTVGILARRLGIAESERIEIRSEIVPIDAHDADLVEVRIPFTAHIRPVPLRDSPPPAGTRIAVIHRNDTTLVASGDTRIEAGDVLLVIAPRDVDLIQLEQWSQHLAAKADDAD